VTAVRRRARISPRWLIVLVPPIVVATLEEVSDSFLDQQLPFPLDNLLISLAVLVIAAGCAWFAFRRIDALTGTLRARNEELEVREASLRALNRVGVAIAALSDVDLVLTAVVRHARELLGADVAVLLLEGPDGRPLLRASDGAPGSLPGRAAVLDDATSDGAGTDAMLAFVDPARAVARLSAPLQRGGTTMGLLAVGFAAVRAFDVDEVDTLASLASQATIALEHARLEARLRDLAVVDERERIARELHDGIAQVLGYVNTKSQAVDGFLEAGRIDDARIQLEELGSAARAVYVDVRETILGLRGPIEPGQGLGSALASHARRVAEASRFVLETAIDPEAAGLRLDPDAEAHVYRIVQEALTNVRKHAAASRVRLVVRVAGTTLLVAVEDDGRGLGPAGMAREMPGYGLRSMRERAARIGASVGVTNRPGGGAAVRLTMPLAGHGRAEAAPVPVGSGAAGATGVG
jgi:signal transduction histidine kinase